MRALPLLAIMMLIIGAALGMSSVFAWVHGAWSSFAGVGVYSHGYLVLGLSAWIGWKHWCQAPPRRLAPAWWGIVPLALCVLAMAVMELLYINSSRVLLLPPLFLSAVLLVFGWEACRRLMVGALFLYFALLPWWILDPFLQAQATAVVSFLMGFTGIPVFIEGFFIHIPAGTFEIATACSGLSFLLSAITLAVFYGIAFLRGWLHRGLLLAAAIAAAIVSNWIRIWTLILIGQYTGLQHWLIDDHYFYGWVLFLVGMVPVFFLGRWLEDREYAAAQRGTKVSTVATGYPSPAALRPSVLAAGAVGGVLLAIPRFFAAEGLPAGEHDGITLPDRLMGGAVRIEGSSLWQPHFRNARQGFGIYESDGQQVEIFVARYDVQGREAHLFQSGNRPFGRAWREFHREVIDVPVDSGTLRVNQVFGELAGQRRVAWYWYEVGGKSATHRFGVKIKELRLLARGVNDGAILMISTRCELDCADQAEMLPYLLPALMSSGIE